MSIDTLGRMAAALRHRGPDGYGFYVAPRVGFAHVRLSIIDVEGGAQPLASEGRRVVVTFNGEIFNYRGLTQELMRLGHVFRTKSDTEVLVHGWEEWGTGLFHRLDGQFAFALHDTTTDAVILVRDRFGVRPLFHAEQGGDLFFGSEAKALFASGEVEATPDAAGLDEVFSFWSARAPRTPFAEVRQLPPGHCGVWRDGVLTVRRWFSRDGAESNELAPDALEELDVLLRSAVACRLRADVPVGGYLSGGLDSSIVCSLAAQQSPHLVRTFSVAFADPQYDESRYQRAVAGAIGSDHAVYTVGPTDIAAHFPDVVRHTETPLTRTAPIPMYLLARLTRERGIKVVLTGEGADETFLGYDLFKEVQVRLFCLRRPDSTIRPRLFDRIHSYQGSGDARGGVFWRRFFTDAGGIEDPLFSHQPRIRLTERIKDYYADDWREATAGSDVVEELRASLPEEFMRWSPLARAAWLEEETLLPGYLLSSQGDRVAMAHGVEARYPFLDHRLAAFARRLPTSTRLLGLKEKQILKRWARDVVPSEVRARTKQPYRAPDVASFFHDSTAEWVRALLDPCLTREIGFFSPTAVAGLLRRAATGRATGVRESQALVAILSTHLWHQSFLRGGWNSITPLTEGGADVVLTQAMESVA